MGIILILWCVWNFSQLKLWLHFWYLPLKVKMQEKLLLLARIILWILMQGKRCLRKFCDIEMKSFNCLRMLSWGGEVYELHRKLVRPKNTLETIRKMFLFCYLWFLRILSRNFCWEMFNLIHHHHHHQTYSFLNIKKPSWRLSE